MKASLRLTLCSRRSSCTASCRARGSTGECNVSVRPCTSRRSGDWRTACSRFSPTPPRLYGCVAVGVAVVVATVRRSAAALAHCANGSWRAAATTDSSAPNSSGGGISTRLWRACGYQQTVGAVCACGRCVCPAALEGQRRGVRRPRRQGRCTPRWERATSGVGRERERAARARGAGRRRRRMRHASIKRNGPRRDA